MLAFKPGDIIAIRGKRLLSRLIEDFSGVISHVGMVTRAAPDVKWTQVTQALMPTVTTLTLTETLAHAAYAYAIQPLKIPDSDLDAIVAYVKSREGVRYDYRDLAWQAADKVFRTDWFTEHLASDELDICSELVAFAYGTRGYTFDVPRRVASPTQIFDYALARPNEFAVLRI